MAKQSEEIKRLKLKLFEVEASLLFSQLRLRAFRDLATLIWESQKVTIHRTDPILTVLARMEKEYADLLLGEYADKNPAMAGILRTLAEQHFGTLPNTGAQDIEGSSKT
jgi:hypothetical protein